MNFNRVIAGVILALSLAFTGCSKSDSGGKDRTAPNLNATPTRTQTSTLDATAANGARLIRSDYKPNEVTQLCDAAIAKVQTRLDAIGSLKTEQATVDNTLLAFEESLADLNDEAQPLTFMGYVSRDEAISAEGSACEEKLGQYFVTINTRRDLYNVIRIQKARTADEQRLLSETLKGFELNGLKLSDSDLEKVKALKSELAAKEAKFSANLNSDATTVAFTADQLKGAQADFLNRLKKTDDGKFIVTTKSTDYLEVMQNVTASETRRLMLQAYLNRAADVNTKLLEEAVVLRQQIAKLLGFETWADYRTSGRMAANKKNVLDFLNDLKGKLAVRNQQDFAQLLKFKKELDPSATKVDQWDIPYLIAQLQKRDYSIDIEKIREYFPAEQVIKGLFQVYSKLLSVNFVPVPNANVWSPDVGLYEIHDTKSGRLIGYFYADFIPRQGKYGHAAAFPLISGRVMKDGNYSIPVSSIVANFTPPSGDKPSLLTHDEVQTIFHEFGHIMHQTLTRAPYASLSGSSVAQDFVEAPSQMLENWVWNPEILQILSGHYLTGEKLPKEMLDKMIAAQNFGQGTSYTKQLLYALFDMNIHTQSGPVDVTKTFEGLYREIMGQEPIEGVHFPASFGHLMGGYDAGYYGYLWSQVYAQDMFSQFPANDLTNPVAGARYRSIILEQGSMKDALDLLREFLGREPNAEAFFKKLGL